MGYLFLLWLSILLHEFGHCFGCRHVGGTADEVLLWPLGGLAMVSPPNNRRAQLITTAAGPAVTVMLTAVFYGATQWIPPTEKAHWVAYAAFVFNKWCAVLNLLPAYPLDGGRIFQWLLVPRLGFHRATLLATRVGKVFAVLIALVAVLHYHDYMFAFLGLWMYMQCEQQQRALAADFGGGEWGGAGRHYMDADREEPRRRSRSARRGPSIGTRVRAWWSRRRTAQRPVVDEDLRRHVDELLDKVSTSGLASLSPEERKFLQEASERFRDASEPPDDRAGS
ncbi:MAG: hypothetical protein HYZ53_07380 [Planctomycetes bacterium]|nr:hypothetical protein [Planctomycetota bacterium]